MNTSRNWVPEQFILKDERTFLTHRSEEEKERDGERQDNSDECVRKGISEFPLLTPSSIERQH